MEDAGVSLVMASYDVRHEQTQKRVSSPDLIQLSDSDCNMPAQPLEEAGYSIMPSEDGEDEDFTVGERVVPAQNRKDEAGEEQELLQKTPQDYPLRVRKGSARSRRGTSGSSDPGLSSPASESSQDSVTPTNLVQGHEGRSDQQHHWHRLVNDEHCQLLGTEEDSSDRHSSNDEDEDNLLQNAQELCQDSVSSPPADAPDTTSQSFEPPPDDASKRISNGYSAATENSADNLKCETSSSADSIWRISEEQRAYYTQQFRRLQPDLKSALPGDQAKTFFEKSKLSTQHLTNIWNLSDVSRDGALSLPEFLVAMHLVVARRNNIPIPPSLPPPLLAVLLPSAGRLSAGKETSSNTAGSSSGGSSVLGGSLPPPSTTAPSLPHSDSLADDPEKDTISPSRVKEWTKFVDSPTSTVSSPGIKPVNFDFQKNAVEKDPLILHPKAVRITPDPHKQADDGGGCYSHEAEGHAAQSSPSFRKGTSSPTPFGGDNNKHGLHRPLPRKPPANGGLCNNSGLSCDTSQYGPASLPMGGVSSSVCTNGGALPPHKKESQPPPPPPPRAVRSHTRSSSLDLNKFNGRGAPLHYLGAPPAVPPRASPGGANSPPRRIQGGSGGRMEGETVEEMAARTGKEEGGLDQPRSSAFEVYRKPSAEGLPFAERAAIRIDDRTENLENKGNTSTNAASGARLKDKKEVSASIKTTRDRNTILVRLNNELNQELVEVIEERIALEMQLEQMKLFTN